MKKLSKTQKDMMIIMLEGTLYQDIRTRELMLDDADKNSYIVRESTFNVLCGMGFITTGHQPNLETWSYKLTDKAIEFLKKNCKDEIEHLL